MAGFRSSGIVVARRTARSFSGCRITTWASDSVPSSEDHAHRAAFFTTCRQVRMIPVSVITTPVPSAPAAVLAPSPC